VRGPPFEAHGKDCCNPNRKDKEKETKQQIGGCAAAPEKNKDHQPQMCNEGK
jgi:hypothetical protein